MPEVSKVAARDALPAHPHPPRTPDELHSYVPYLLNRLTTIWNAKQNRDLAPYGINGTILRALSALDIYGTLAVNEIAGYAFVEQSHASRTIDQMVAAGLVVRSVSRADSRRRQVALTEKGSKLLETLRSVMERSHGELINDLSAEMLDTCVRSLLVMARNVDVPSAKGAT